MRNFDLIGLTPAGLTDASIAIAAARAGGIGILDLELCPDADAAAAPIAALQRYGRGRAGLRLDGLREAFLDEVTRDLPERIRTVILIPGEPGDLPSQVRRLRERGLSVLVEATSLEVALAACENGADGVVARGHEAGGRIGDETTFILLQRLLDRVDRPCWAHGGIGLHTAAAARAAGAAGVVLDAQLLDRKSVV